MDKLFFNFFGERKTIKRKTEKCRPILKCNTQTGVDTENYEFFFSSFMNCQSVIEQCNAIHFQWW